MSPPITSFTGEHAFLSNFAHYPMWLPFGAEVSWPTAEHAFQAMKAVRADEAEWVHDAPTPSEAKRRGRQVLLRPDWAEARRNWMLFVLQAKFMSVRGLANQLVATGDAELIEGNTWGDTYWGAVRPGQRGFSSDLPYWHVNVKGPLDCGDDLLAGHNWLGRILMMCREVLA